jgi:hypothetical protein
MSAHPASTSMMPAVSAPGRPLLAELAASVKNVRIHHINQFYLFFISIIIISFDCRRLVLEDGFTCPKLTAAESLTEPHPRYPHPTDCQKFYVCLNGVTPREQNCDLGEVFNTNSKQCDLPENVAEWYRITIHFFSDFMAFFKYSFPAALTGTRIIPHSSLVR